MSATANAVLGILFLVLALITVGLMFQYWGYPFDKENQKSTAPQWKMNIHRGFGVAFAIVYVILMIQMVPRLWEYQVEFPARTVAHIVLGLTLGFLLTLKIIILRFFRHFEEWMPLLGVGILLCTFLLLALSLPAVYKEQTLEAGAFTEANRERVARLLPNAGLPAHVDVAHLSREDQLRDGRDVVLTKCVYCHDLKTIIAKPRQPSDWFRTVRRMREKPTLGEAIEAHEMYTTTAFLVAITPDLQKSAKAKRADGIAQQKTRDVLEPEPPPAGDAGPPPAAVVDPAVAKAEYTEICSQCHELSDVEGNPPQDAEQVDDLIERMIDNDMEADPEDLKLVKWYLNETFATSE